MGIHVQSVGIHSQTVGFQSASVGTHSQSVGIHSASTGIHSASVGICSETAGITIQSVHSECGDSQRERESPCVGTQRENGICANVVMVIVTSNHLGVVLGTLMALGLEVNHQSKNPFFFSLLPPIPTTSLRLGISCSVASSPSRG